MGCTNSKAAADSSTQPAFTLNEANLVERENGPEGDVAFAEGRTRATSVVSVFDSIDTAFTVIGGGSQAIVENDLQPLATRKGFSAGQLINDLDKNHTHNISLEEMRIGFCAPAPPASIRRPLGRPIPAVLLACSPRGR